MDNKRYKTSIVMIAGLTVVAGGLFGYQNFYYNKQQLKQQTTIYVAKSDIQAKTKLSADMLEAKSIPASGVLDNYVTQANLDKVVGKELKGGLLTGEPLTTVRVNADGSDLDSNLVLKLEPDFMGQIQANDNVKVYVMLTDKNTGDVTMKDLFSNKKILPGDSANQQSIVNVSAGQTSDKSTQLLIKVSDAELQAYYKAKATGKIVVSKITDLDTEDISSKGSVQDSASKDTASNQYDAKSSEAKSSYRPTDGSDNSIAMETYVVQPGDTVDSLSKKFKTTPDVISKLNNNSSVFKSGDKIVVPAI